MLPQSSFVSLVARYFKRTIYIEHFIQQCLECVKLTTNPMELLMPILLPWERVTADIFQLNESTFLLVVECFSKYPEVLSSILPHQKL